MDNSVWSTLLLTLALSADGFLVGLSYGARNIVVPGRSFLILGLCTGAGMSISMVLGQAAQSYVPLWLSRWAGGSVLIALGLWQLWQGWAHSTGHSTRTGEPILLARWRLKLLGVVVEIIREPEVADRDASGFIDPREAVALGIALGLDTLAAGFAASLAGFGVWLALCVTLGLIICTWLGLAIGKQGRRHAAQPHRAFIPALMLIILGLWELR